MDAVLLIFGGLLLMFAGDSLVRGAVALGLRFGLSAAFIGLSVVSFGTSAPELIVSIEAALTGSPDIALGNVVGSNIANTLLIVGVPALLVVLSAPSQELRHSYLMMLAATALFAALAMVGMIGRLSGLILLAALVAMLSYSYRNSNGTSDDFPDEGGAVSDWKIAALLILGVVGLPVGSHFLIEGARGVATEFGLSEAAIGLTIVALGTSLPELAASVAAAFRGRGDVALANVIGSNMMNLLAVIGATALVTPLSVSRVFLTFDIPAMVFVSLILAPCMVWKLRLGRRFGLVSLLLYASFAYLVLGDVKV